MFIMDKDVEELLPEIESLMSVLGEKVRLNDFYLDEKGDIIYELERAMALVMDLEWDEEVEDSVELSKLKKLVVDFADCRGMKKANVNLPRTEAYIKSLVSITVLDGLSEAAQISWKAMLHCRDMGIEVKTQRFFEDDKDEICDKEDAVKEVIVVFYPNGMREDNAVKGYLAACDAEFVEDGFDVDYEEDGAVYYSKILGDS